MINQDFHAKKRYLAEKPPIILTSRMTARMNHPSLWLSSWLSSKPDKIALAGCAQGAKWAHLGSLG